MPNLGGARPGAGRPKGRKNTATLAKEASREATRAIILPHMADMLEAQLSHAKGLKYLVVRDKKTGKFIRVTEAMAKAKSGQSDDEETIEVWEKDPSVQAFTDLMNRVNDKPKEQEQDLNVRGSLDIVDLLRKRHERNRQNP